MRNVRLMQRLSYKHTTEQLNEVKAGHTGHGLLIERDGHINTKSDLINQINEDIAHNNKFVIPDDFIVSAVFQKYGIKNANGRIYPENILKKEVERYLKEEVAEHRAVGALDHPASVTLSGHDITHNILDLRWEQRTLVGEMKLHLSPGYKRYGICSTSGDLVANMLLDGITVGVSSRAVGSVEERFGDLIVGDDLEIIGWDVVMEPSTPNAYIKENPQDLQAFIETDQTKKYKNKITENLDIVKNILSD